MEAHPLWHGLALIPHGGPLPSFLLFFLTGSWEQEGERRGGCYDQRAKGSLMTCVWGNECVGRMPWTQGGWGMGP